MSQRLRTIGCAVKASGLSLKMIRYYEEIGLIQAPKRTDSGYRIYSEEEIHSFRFIKRARSFGFAPKQIGELVKLWQDKNRASIKVKKLATDYIIELNKKISELQATKAILEYLADHCRGDEQPDCPILNQLAASEDLHQLYYGANANASYRNSEEDEDLLPIS